MKWYFIFAVAAMVALAACSKIETIESTREIPITFSVMNLLVDLAYAFIDPRIKSTYERPKKPRGEAKKPVEAA